MKMFHPVNSLVSTMYVAKLKFDSVKIYSNPLTYKSIPNLQIKFNGPSGSWVIDIFVTFTIVKVRFSLQHTLCHNLRS